jgi:hypothetical protein
MPAKQLGQSLDIDMHVTNSQLLSCSTSIRGLLIDVHPQRNSSGDQRLWTDVKVGRRERSMLWQGSLLLLVEERSFGG